ncbi:starch-binding protein [Clostridium estertheticum]|uniref:TIM-barrel domain-containing protein n=1 Tax=Clostridium estertheticum TaxID=238834 RepID=UPI001C0AE320|nr:TIM-barrel domain-containing protein [Clostridium estertheticum]MBU3215626.1 starch-binding protein [Clostridium estertheticum]WAG56757.1 starch-binding protein [Clostridium estertheticum]
MVNSKRHTCFKKIMYLFMVITLVFSNFTFISNVKVNAAVGGGITVKGDTITIPNGSDQYIIQICEPQILKVDYRPNGASSDETQVIDPNKSWSTGNTESIDIKSDPMVITTSKMIVKINKSDLSVSVYDSSNGLLIKQTALPSNGVTFSHNSGDNFYGISGYNNGENSSAGMLRTGTINVQAGTQGHCGAPFVWSNNGYGILVDSDGGKISLGEKTLGYSAISKKNTQYYIMVGSPTDILSSESDITGKSPMSPKWATGFTNTQWGWPDATKTDEQQLTDVINTYRSKQIPIDNFCLDFDWKKWGSDNYGEFKWNTTNFPGAESGQLKKAMSSAGIKLTGIMKPRVLVPSVQATDVKAMNGWLPGSSPKNDYCANVPMQSLNYGNPSVRTWLWNHTQDAFDKGIVGFWNDECDGDNGFGNFDNMNMQKSFYDGQTAYTNQRVWSLNRTYYAGAQRYGYGMWSGDIGSGFDSMANQRERMLSAVNLGEAKWGMDTGGFNGQPNPENYARWLEFSAFTPIFRVHGTKVTDSSMARYPWNYGTTAEAAAKKIMQLRYTLIPYIYKYDQQASDTGIGLIKSLMMAYPNDPNAANDKESWMFGDSLLVSPVVTQGQTSKSIYLPEGNWIDYFKGTTYTGGKTINYPIDSSSWQDVPLFIKSGAIIPSQDYENYVGEKKMTNIYVDAFPTVQPTSFNYYDDDGDTYNYKSGNCFEQKLTVQRSNDCKSVQFDTAQQKGSYTPDVKNYIVKLHVKSTGAVTVGGEAVPQCSNLDALKNATGDGYVVGTDVYGAVVYVKVAAGQIKNIVAPCTFNPEAAKKTTVYVKDSASSANLQYSLDNGNTWSSSQAMTKSDKIGYFQTDLNYTLTSSYPVKVRYSDGSLNKPTDAGVALPVTGDICTIANDGKVTAGAPKTNTTNLYIGTTTNNQVKLQYLDDNGKWSSDILMIKYGVNNGQFMSQLAFPTDVKTPVVRYSEDSGLTWKPSSLGQAVGAGDYYNDSTGAIIAGNPNWSNGVTIYYKKGYTTPYTHWRPSTGTWTTSPGTKMQDSEIAGYSKATLNIGTATSAEVCFNDGNGIWDNNGGKNYIFNAGISTFNAGIIKSGAPSGTSQLTVAVDIKGGTYALAQTVKLTASSTASIYYTTDGTTPTIASTKYIGTIKISANTTLKAIAVDSQGNQSSVDTEQYIINISTVSTTVHYKNPSSWGAPNLYYYDASKVLTSSTWPGIKMNSDGNSWYSYTIQNCSTAKVIFNDGKHQNPGMNQPGFDVTGEKWYEDGKWYTSNPDVLVVSPKIKKLTYTTAQSVPLTSSNMVITYYNKNGIVLPILSPQSIGTFRNNNITTLKYNGPQYLEVSIAS